MDDDLKRLFLLRKAIEEDKKRTQRAGLSTQGLLVRANLHRMLGERQKAMEQYRLAGELDPMKKEFKQYYRILDGRGANTSQAVEVTPFFCRNNFLPVQLLHELLGYVFANHQHATESGVYLSENQELVSTQRRQSKNLDVELPIREKYLKHIEGILPEVLETLDREAISPLKMDLRILIYEDGGHFIRHKDRQEYTREVQRELTLIYYFHREPRSFEGGHLLLYDQNNGEALPTYTRLNPENNSLVCFSSDRFHEVTRVGLQSPDIHDGRFALVCWLYRQ